uniref:Cathepsin L6 n=1 Tax=Dysdercus peruvianus TaxID=685034 RepID=A0A7U3NJE4_9HEMI|nr:cathepsin L6 [Dysdercus peruvianus]
MKFITFLPLLVCCQGLLRPEWENFKKIHGKSYVNRIEEEYRLNVYLENKRLIEEHNIKFAAGNVTFSMGMNEFGDLTSEEVNAMMNNYQDYNDQDVELRTEFVASTSSADIPSSIDWRDKGAVTPVKHQGSCGSCWAFSATGSLEGQHFLKTGKLVSLSEQNLVDCSERYHNHGCHGGTFIRGFNYIRDNGIDLEASYPYETKSGDCRFNASEIGAKLKGYAKTLQYDEEALKVAVAKVGPVSVGMDASKQSFHHYTGGIYYEKSCSSKRLNHAVLVVGYGTENGTDYWIVKNSWGKRYGEHGYIRVARNKKNHCGIATRPAYPTL